MITEIDNNIWTINGSEVTFAGAPMQTRMTVIRLNSGNLWVHSPIHLSSDVQAFISGLGGHVVALVAPNKFHHLFVEAWINCFPEATLFAEPELKRKLPSLSRAEDITDTAADLYRDDIDQVIFTGNRLFQEAVFFHKQSKTLIFTDLMTNLKTDGMKLLPRLFLKFEGVVYPHGGVPRLYRWFTHDKKKARKCLKVLLEWSPKHLVFCHGEPFTDDAQQILMREFKYLLDSSAR